MKRPIGLILSAIVLGLIALLLLLIAALMAFSGTFAAHQPAFAASRHLILYLMLAIGAFYAVLTVWAILTVIGILRLRQWGRYSILIIGGGLAAFNLFTALFTILSRTVLSGLTPQQPAVDPHIAAVVATFMIGVNLLFAAVGIWWLIYFNLRSTRNLFSLHSDLLHSLTRGLRHNRLTSPRDPQMVSSQAPHTPPQLSKSSAGFSSLRPSCCLPLVFLPVPAFLLGFILPR